MSDSTLLPPEETVISFSRSGAAMETVSAELDARSRKNCSLILRKLSSIGQVRAAQAIGVNESTISRMKEGDFDRIGKLLAALGLKVVPVEMEVMDRKKIDAMLELARAYVNDITADALVVNIDLG